MRLSVHAVNNATLTRSKLSPLGNRINGYHTSTKTFMIRHLLGQPFTDIPDDFNFDLFRNSLGEHNVGSWEFSCLFLGPDTNDGNVFDSRVGQEDCLEISGSDLETLVLDEFLDTIDDAERGQTFPRQSSTLCQTIFRKKKCFAEQLTR